MSLTLSEVSPFKGMPLDALSALLSKASPKPFAAGSVLARQGEVADRVYVLLSGRVFAERALAEESCSVLLADLGPGDVAGDIVVNDGATCCATLTAVEDTIALELTAAAVTEAVTESLELAKALLRNLSHRLRTLDEMVEELHDPAGYERQSSPLGEIEDVDLDHRTARRGGRRVSLTRAEWEVMEAVKDHIRGN
jgi:CRP-like cAMP-binding protein